MHTLLLLASTLVARSMHSRLNNMHIVTRSMHTIQ